MRMMAHVTTFMLAMAMAMVMVLCVGVSGCDSEESSISSKVVKLSRAALPEASSLTLASSVQPRYISELGFRVSGKVEQITVHAGQLVKAGDVLGRMDTRDLNIALSIAEAHAAEIEMARENARQRSRRYHLLAKQGHISDLDNLDLVAELDILSRRHEQALLEVKKRRAELQDASLRADMSGVIDRIYVEENELISSFTPAFRILSGDHLEVEIDLPVSVVARVRNHSASASVFLEGKQHVATLRELAAAAGDNGGTYRARYVVETLPEEVEIGRVVPLTLSFSDAPGGTVLVPLEAVFSDGGREAVWVYDEETSTISKRAVSVIQISERGLVIEGVAEGVRLVAAGVSYLAHGQLVKPYE